MAQDFDTRHDGRLKPLDLRRHWNFLQYAVDAVANAQFIFEWFEVDVRSPQLDRVAQYLVDESDDRSVFGRAIEIGVFVAAFVHDLEGRFFVERVDGVRAHPEALFHLPLDGLAGREDRLGFRTGQGPQGSAPPA